VEVEVPVVGEDWDLSRLKDLSLALLVCPMWSKVEFLDLEA